MYDKKALINCPHCTAIAYRTNDGRINCYECGTSTGEFMDDTYELDVEVCLDNQDYINNQLSLKPEDRDIPSIFTI